MDRRGDGRPVVSDLRTADVAAGGQGAPLVPLLDALLLAPFVEEGLTAAALNLGGIANVTVCAPGKPVRAWDTGPANALVDAAAGGSTATAGSRPPEPWTKGCWPTCWPSRSTPGRRRRRRARNCSTPDTSKGSSTAGSPSPADLVATLTELTVRTVADALAGVDVVVASGAASATPSCSPGCGGNCAPGSCCPTIGCPAGEKEAIAFALLGYAFATGRPGNVPSCTGARGERVLGQVTPGRSGLPATTPVEPWPAALHLS